MDPTGVWAMGVQLKIGDGAGPEVFAAIPGLDAISGPEQTRDTIETTSHSATGGFKTFIGGLRDSGELTCDIFWIGDAAQVALATAYADADETTNFQVVLPDADTSTYQFAAFVTNLSWSLDQADAIKRSLTLKISGPVEDITA